MNNYWIKLDKRECDDLRVGLVSLGINRTGLSDEFNRMCTYIDSNRKYAVDDGDDIEPNLHLQFHGGCWQIWHGLSDFIRDCRGVFGVGYLTTEPAEEIVRDMIIDAASIDAESWCLGVEVQDLSLGVYGPVQLSTNAKEVFSDNSAKPYLAGSIVFTEGGADGQPVTVDSCGRCEVYRRESLKNSPFALSGGDCFELRGSGFVGARSVQFSLTCSGRDGSIEAWKGMLYEG